MTTLIVLAVDLALTIVAAGVVGPAAFRFSALGLPGLLARAPFYLLRFYIGLAVLLPCRKPAWYLWGPSVGLILTLPLAFWSVVPGCPIAEPFVNVLLGTVQGFVLAWLARKVVQPRGAALPA